METASPDSDPEQAALVFICKRLKLNLKKLSEEEKKWLKKIAQKSDLLKNPNPVSYTHLDVYKRQTSGST